MPITSQRARQRSRTARAASSIRSSPTGSMCSVRSTTAIWILITPPQSKNRSMHNRVALSAIVIAMPFGAPVYAQQALVLSGGGSRGIAHVGVLAVMEQRGYDPDIVVGTSMGAVVGALYAAGYTPAEIVEQITAAEWRGMFDP